MSASRWLPPWRARNQSDRGAVSACSVFNRETTSPIALSHEIASYRPSPRSPLRLSGLRDPIRVVSNLDSRLAAGTQAPSIDGWSGAPSSFFAAATRTIPAWPLRTMSASASMTRTVRPHPAPHSGQTLGFHTATPGTMSSAGQEPDDLVFGIAAAGKRRARARYCRELDE